VDDKLYLPQDDRYKAHDAITNRRLLWHGTNVAVVAAILKSGLRIMPHSGGRVGKGIYLASENSKSAGYGKSMDAMYVHNWRATHYWGCTKLEICDMYMRTERR